MKNMGQIGVNTGVTFWDFFTNKINKYKALNISVVFILKNPSEKNVL